MPKNLLRQTMSVIQWVKKSEMMKDSMLVGVLGGTLGASAMELSNFLFFWNRRSKFFTEDLLLRWSSISFVADN